MQNILTDFHGAGKMFSQSTCKLYENESDLVDYSPKLSRIIIICQVNGAKNYKHNQNVMCSSLELNLFREKEE